LSENSIISDSKLIVDNLQNPLRSRFDALKRLDQYPAHSKYTIYTLSHLKGIDDVKAEYHWELEDTMKWPDCEYAIDVGTAGRNER